VGDIESVQIRGKKETVGGGSPLGLGYFTIALLDVLKKASNNQFQVSGFKFHVKIQTAVSLARNGMSEISLPLDFLYGERLLQR
jgi:hypothetical protein